jgi:anti-anti-sigma factor
MPSARSQNTLEVKQVEPGLVVTITHARLFEEEEIDCLGEQLCALAASPPGLRLVLDFTPVEQVSTHLLGELLVLHKRVLTRGGRLAICGLNPRLRETFEVLRLTSIFTVRDTEAEAVRSLGAAR